jgi:hypothetical protein
VAVPSAADGRKDVEFLALLDQCVEASEKAHVAPIQKDVDVVNQFAIIGHHVRDENRKARQ